MIIIVDEVVIRIRRKVLATVLMAVISEITKDGSINEEVI